MSVRMHGTARLTLGGFLWNLASEDFSTICGENSRLKFKSDKNNGFLT